MKKILSLLLSLCTLASVEEISFAQMSLEALTEKGRQGSSNGNLQLWNQPQAVPAVPRLNALPAGTSTLPVSWPSSRQPTAEVAINGQPVPAPKYEKGFFLIDVSQIQTGRHSLAITVYEEGKEVTRNTFDFAFAEPELPCPEERRLNSLTTELLAQTLQGTTTVAFTVPRRTWVYFKLESPAKPKMTLSGDENPLLTADSPRPEAQRRLKPGQYTVTFDTPVAGKLFIRTVPVLYKYGGINVTAMPGIGGSDLEFHQKHVFGVFNTIGARGVSEELRPYTASLGLECVDACVPPATKPFGQKHIEDFVERLNSPKGAFAVKSGQWVEFDEYMTYNTAGLLNTVVGLEQLQNPLGKDLFHWYVGAPFVPGVHHKVLSSFMNSGGGHGYIAYEEYLKPFNTEQGALMHISDSLTGLARSTNDFIPDSNRAFGFVFANFHQLPLLSVDWHPEVNFKYFLDMEYHYLANHPEFNGLGVVGYWGFNNANEEIARWCCEIVRHYVLEGRTDRLSDAYGYTYLLPHLQNNDFDDGLEGWRCTGKVTTGSRDYFASNNELRYHCYAKGNSFAVLHGNPETPPTISQTAVGLVPGKPYVLEFVTADYDDTMANKFNPRRFGIEPTLTGAKIIHEFTYVDKRPKAQFNLVTAKTNYRYYRFIPSSDKMELTFTGSDKEGENLLLNFIRIAPYFEEN